MQAESWPLITEICLLECRAHVTGVVHGAPVNRVQRVRGVALVNLPNMSPQNFRSQF
jgi:hypothetical protein